MKPDRKSGGGTRLSREVSVGFCKRFWGKDMREVLRMDEGRIQGLREA
jgi:hypothetical protein